MTTLTTPEEVASFLAEHVMGWTACHDVECEGCDAPAFKQADDWKGERHEWWVVNRSDDPDELWDPWRNVADAIEALEAWASAARFRWYNHARWHNGDHSFHLHAPDENPQTVFKCGAASETAASRALCAAHGATVKIEEDWP